MDPTRPYWGDTLTRACIAAFGLTGAISLVSEEICRWRTGSYPDAVHCWMLRMWPLLIVAACASLVAAVSRPTRWWLMLTAIALTLAFGYTAAIGLIMLYL